MLKEHDREKENHHQCCGQSVTEVDHGGLLWQMVRVRLKEKAGSGRQWWCHQQEARSFRALHSFNVTLVSPLSTHACHPHPLQVMVIHSIN